MTKENKGLLPLIGTREPKPCIKSFWLKKQMNHSFYTCHCGRQRCFNCNVHQQKDGSWT